MIRHLLLALALAAGLSSAAQAQSVQALPSCGTASVPVGPGGRLFVDTSGNLCTAGGGGGGSGTVTSAPVTKSAAVVTLPANTATQIGAAGLKSFAAQVQGANPVIVGYDNTVCTGTGITLAAANGSSPGQATFEYPASTTAYWACSVAGSTVAVVRGQ